MANDKYRMFMWWRSSQTFLKKWVRFRQLHKYALIPEEMRIQSPVSAVAFTCYFLSVESMSLYLNHQTKGAQYWTDLFNKLCEINLAEYLFGYTFPRQLNAQVLLLTFSVLLCILRSRRFMGFELTELGERGQRYSQQLLIWPLFIFVESLLGKKGN